MLAPGVDPQPSVPLASALRVETTRRSLDFGGESLARRVAEGRSLLGCWLAELVAQAGCEWLQATLTGTAPSR